MSGHRKKKNQEWFVRLQTQHVHTNCKDKKIMDLIFTSPITINKCNKHTLKGPMIVVNLTKKRIWPKRPHCTVDQKISSGYDNWSIYKYLYYSIKLNFHVHNLCIIVKIRNKKVFAVWIWNISFQAYIVYRS